MKSPHNGASYGLAAGVLHSRDQTKGGWERRQGRRERD